MRYVIFLALCLAALPAFAVDCSIGQYANMAEALQGSDRIPVSGQPVSDDSVVTFTSTSTQSAVFAASTRYIAITCTAKAHFQIGSNPTATTTNLWVPADTLLYLGVWRRELRIAFIQGS